MLKDKNSSLSKLSDSLWIYKLLESGNKTIQKRKKDWVGGGFAFRVGQTLYILLKNVRNSLRRKSRELAQIPNGSVLYYCNSQNTYKVLNPLHNHLPGVFFWQTNQLTKQENKGGITHNFTFPLFWSIQAIFAFISFNLFHWNKGWKYPNLFFENYGKLEENIILLKKIKPRGVVFANDHNVQNRLFLHACKELEIKTFYLQHATVTTNFPPLAFTKSFLFGEKDKLTYESVGPSLGEVELTGPITFQHLFEIKKQGNNEGSIIGISVNLIDDLSEVTKVVREILKKTVLRIIIRQHPRDNRSLDLKDDRLIIEPASKFELLDYFSKINFHIAGDSSIHLEASYVGITSFYHKMSGDTASGDRFAFVKEGMINEYKIDHLTNVNDFSNFVELKHFLFSVGEPWESNVSHHIASSIKVILEK
ncbi:MAG: hypothetical protein ACI81S_000484 [Sphingobacteriales bacterium]|jgi:hypothetical protein